MRTLFTSRRPLQRAENIKAIYDAYDGEKAFSQMDLHLRIPDADMRDYDLLVTDEFTAESPGKVILVGHGIAGGKTYGFDQPQPYINRRCAELLTYVVTTSEEMIPLTAKQSGVSESQVLALGMPRTDAYFRPYQRKSSKRIYLYAPTYRGVNEPEMPSVDWQRIDSLLSDRELLIVKPHMLTGELLHGEYRHIKAASSDVPTTPYLLECDVLITDYSTIMLDAHVAGKPVILFDKDFSFASVRGMYLRYPDEYAGRYCTDEDKLVKLARFANAPLRADIKCGRKTAGACDGHSTERVINLIKSIGESL